MIDAVADAGENTPVWTFLGPRPAAWWIRRRLHEATVHRADAALALGLPYDLTASLAADGISEWLDRLAAEQANGAAASIEPGATLHLHATDSAVEWMIASDEAGMSWEHGHGKATTAIRGPAVDLLLALLRRRSAADIELRLFGDQEVWTNWLDRTSL